MVELGDFLQKYNVKGSWGLSGNFEKLLFRFLHDFCSQSTKYASANVHVVELLLCWKKYTLRGQRDGVWSGNEKITRWCMFGRLNAIGIQSMSRGLGLGLGNKKTVTFPIMIGLRFWGKRHCATRYVLDQGISEQKHNLRHLWGVEMRKRDLVWCLHEWRVKTIT